MINNEIPTRTNKSNYAKSYLYHDYNDIDFFIEDTDITTKKIMLTLLQRSFNNSIKIQQIFPLGGREEVIEKYNYKDESRKQVFIIDGDLYLLFETKPFQKGLVSLDRYCVENYLIDNKSILDFLYEECYNETDYQNMQNLFSLDTWIKCQEKLFMKLFIEYGVEKKNNLRIQTVKYKVYRLQDSTTKDSLDKNLVTQRVKNLRKEVKQSLGCENYKKNRVEIFKNTQHSTNKLLKYVSAKDYIIPLLFNKMKIYSRSSIIDDKIKYRLSKSCDILPFKNIVKQHI